MIINWRDDVMALCWVSEKGFEFDLNPNIYPAMLKDGRYRELAVAIRNFGAAMLAGKIEMETRPRIFDGRGNLLQ